MPAPKKRKAKPTGSAAQRQLKLTEMFGGGGGGPSTSAAPSQPPAVPVPSDPVRPVDAPDDRPAARRSARKSVPVYAPQSPVAETESDSGSESDTDPGSDWEPGAPPAKSAFSSGKQIIFYLIQCSHL